MIRFLIGMVLCVLASASLAYEKSAPASITLITAQATDHRFAVVDGTLCGTNVFTIRTTTGTGREQFALVLAAASSGKKIILEIWAACPSTDPSKNWGMLADNIAISVQY